MKARLKVAPPVEYPEVGVYHPRMKTRLSDRVTDLPATGDQGTVGLLLPPFLSTGRKHRSLRWRHPGFRGARPSRHSPPLRLALMRDPPLPSSSGRTAIRASTRWCRSPASPWWEDTAYNDSAARRGHLGRIGRPLSRRTPGGISNPRRVGALGARAAAGGVHHHGGYP